MNKILVIDDDKRIASALAIRLSTAGYEVLTASDGVQGLKAAVGQKPALIITDIWMPRPLGFLNHERMQILGLGAVQVIYITASKKKDLRQIAMEEGAAAFFEKPYNPEELLSCIACTLAQRRTREGERPWEPQSHMLAGRHTPSAKQSDLQLSPTNRA